MSGIAELLSSVWPWALGIGLLLIVPGVGLFGMAEIQRRRLLPQLEERHPIAWQYLQSRKNRLFEWTPLALRTGDAGLDARLLHQRRLQHVAGVLALPGGLLLMVANVASMIS
jgi:hypothetical protein